MGISYTGPTVSVVIPCRNEKDHIETCLRSILAQEPPPGGFEVIVVDGMSDDGARDILSRLAVADSRLRIIDNPNRTTPCGMNAGIREARGQYIAIMGAHTRYAHDYLCRCVEMLEEHPEICCAGGPIVSEGKSTFGRAIAAAMSHPVGIGNAKHRFPNYEGYAEGACFPMFRKEIFDKVGLYDETLVRNQDDELNYRIARKEGRSLFPRRARCITMFGKLLRNCFAVFPIRLLASCCSKETPTPRFYTSNYSDHVFSVTLSCWCGLYLPGQWRLIAAALPLAYASILIRLDQERRKKLGY